MIVPPLNKTEYLVNTAKKWTGRNFITKLDKTGALLPVVLLEAAVTGGRTYQAYKRDGFVEARERVTEESLGAVFWLFGAKMFEKVFDFAGKKFGNMPKESYDVAHDAVRKPFANFIAKKSEELKLVKEADITALKNKLASFSCGKTIAGLLTACAFIGFVVPKMNQAITKKLYGVHPKGENESERQKITIKDLKALYSAHGVSINAVENFKSRQDGGDVKADAAVKKGAKPSFKGYQAMTAIVQKFQENDVWKLLGTDVGTVTGRTANARNNDERVEIMFRDISSIYFYCFSTAAIVGFLNKNDKFGGFNTKLNPMSAAEVHNELINKMSDKGLDSMSAKRFREFALGKENFDNDLYKKAFPEKAPVAPKKKFFGLISPKPKKVLETIDLKEFEKLIDAQYADKTKASKLKAIAKEMSGLQPAREGVKILTETQVEDVLKGGAIRRPEFMKNVLNNMFKTKNSPDRLTNEFQYISQKSVDEKRQRILDYVESIIKNAEDKSENVNWKNMLKTNKRNLKRNGIYMGAGMAVSALFLSTIIPKIQYYITFLRTGKNTFPGVENMDKQSSI